MKGLTEKQSAVLAYIRDRVAADGYPPTVREIAAHLGTRNFNAAVGHLKALEEKGLIRRKAGGARAITVV